MGSRIKLKYTRAIIDAIHNGSLLDAKTVTDPVFGVDIIAECEGVPGEVLTPWMSWDDRTVFDTASKNLAGLFIENFKQFEDQIDDAVKGAGPKG